MSNKELVEVIKHTSLYTHHKEDALKVIYILENYEQRLKADLEAILTELQLSIEEEREDCIKLSNCPQERFGMQAMAQRSQIVIQEKIDALRGEKNE